MSRERMPNRRDSRTTFARWPLDSGRKIHITVGFTDDGRPLEVFLRGGGQVGSDMDFLLDDIAISISRCLQHGDTAERIADGLSRSPTGIAMSMIGAIVDKIQALGEVYALEMKSVV